MTTNEEQGALALPSTAQGTALVHAASAASTDLRLALEHAVMNPREIQACAEWLTTACRRDRMAERAEYSFKRGTRRELNTQTGKWETVPNIVRGVSVYLAREAARCWGHIRFGFAVLEDRKDDRHLRATAVDLQSGVQAVHDAVFPKKIQRKERTGWNQETNRPIFETRWVRPDERELMELTNREGAKAVRNVLLQILPEWYVDEAVDVARKRCREIALAEVAEASGDEHPHAALLSSFDALGVSSEQVAAWLGLPLDQIAQATPEQIVELKRIGRSIVDGHTTREDHFKPAQRPEAGTPAAGEGEPRASTLDDLIGE